MSQAWQKHAIVVTGSSGSGKSLVSQYLSELGAVVLSADEFARAALAPGAEALKEVKKIFGHEVFEGETLNRRKLATVVFKNPALKLKLDNIVHPIVEQLAQNAFDKIKESGKLIIYDCPLFFETKLREKGFKSVVVVTAPEELKIQRLEARDWLTEDQARERLANQLPDAEKVMLADHVIVNDAGVDELKKKVERVFEKLSNKN